MKRFKIDNATNVRYHKDTNMKRFTKSINMKRRKLMKRVAPAQAKASKISIRKKLKYVKTNWQLYIIFLMPGAFRTIYIASGIWQGAGWASILYTAALANASQELTEAAIIDGANIFQQIKNVDLPAIKNIIVIQFILQAGNIMSIGFEKAYALQTDLNMASSEILATYVYKMGLLNGDYGFSTAVGLFNSVINIIHLLFVNKVVEKLNNGQGL